MRDVEDIALVDMDQTLVDYESALTEELMRMQSYPEKGQFNYRRDMGVARRPDWLETRIRLIKSQPHWWENLPPLKLGFEILEILRMLEFKIMILTQGPLSFPVAWAEKVRWCMKHVPDLDITITRDKGLVYGKVLVDDYTKYVTRWLDWRPRGLVIMPATEENKDFKHDQVIRYDGNNYNVVRKALEEVKGRKAGEELTL